MAGGLPEGKGHLRDSCPWWRFFLHCPPWRMDVIPGKESGDLPTESTGASGAGRLCKGGAADSMSTRAWGLLVRPGPFWGCCDSRSCCSFTHPGWRRGFRAAHSSVTKASRPGGDKLPQRLDSPEGAPGTGLMIEPTCERCEKPLVFSCFCFLPQVYSYPGPHQVQGGMGGVGQVSAGWPIWSFPNCSLHFKEHLLPPAGKRPCESQTQIHKVPPQGQGGCQSQGSTAGTNSRAAPINVPDLAGVGVGRIGGRESR